MLQTKYQELSILSVARRIYWVVDTVPSSVCVFFRVCIYNHLVWKSTTIQVSSTVFDKLGHQNSIVTWLTGISLWRMSARTDEGWQIRSLVCWSVGLLAHSLSTKSFVFCPAFLQLFRKMDMGYRSHHLSSIFSDTALYRDSIRVSLEIAI